MHSKIIALLLAFPASSFATSYCFDYAAMTASNIKRELNACGVREYNHQFDNLISRLVEPARSKKDYIYDVITATTPLFETFNYSLPYSASTSGDPCVQAQVKRWNKLQLDIMIAVSLCYGNQ